MFYVFYVIILCAKIIIFVEYAKNQTLRYVKHIQTDFCIFEKNYGNYIASNTSNCAVNILKNIVSG